MRRIKKYETRSWAISEPRGWVALHAAQRWRGDQQRLVMVEPFRSALTGIYIEEADGRLTPPALGHVLGLVNWDRCFSAEKVRPVLAANNPIELAYGDYADGRFAHWLAGAIVFNRPIAATGKQGWWHWVAPNWVGELLRGKSGA
ncbi:MAG TPA: hypothetical protein ENJ56_04250 [Anaerolineae bacterium]|nr:hypothetical protein [Anaerolineae bacterium]